MAYNDRLSVQKIESFIEKCDEYRKQMSAKGIKLTDQEIFAHVTETPAPRFYVDVYFTAVQLKRISRGQKPKLYSPRKRKMYYDIYDLYCKKVGNNLKSHIEFSILEQVISSPAPQYYISPNTVKQLINIYYRYKRLRNG